MKLCPVFGALVGAGVTLLALTASAQLAEEPAEVIIHNAKVLTVNPDFGTAQALAVRDGRILAVGRDREVDKFRGPNTLVINAEELTVMPGLYDAEVQSYNASTTELNGSLPTIGSIDDAVAYIRYQATNKPAGAWITLNWLYPTRLKEGRLPTKVELDSATTNHPVLWNFGTLAVVNSKALEVSKITKDTLDPTGGEVVKDHKTLKPTGLLRKTAISLLKLPKNTRPLTRAQQIEALKHLYQLYNQQGITSIQEDGAEPAVIDLFRELSRAGDLTVRINCARLFEGITNLDDAIARLDAMTNTPAGKQPYGPTGAGDDWVRIGPLKTVLDGDVQMATAYLRTPYGIGPTYKISEPAYRGELKQDLYVLPDFFTEAAQRGWQLSARSAGDAALDFLLNCYQQVQFKVDIRERRFVASHSEFQATQQWERLVKLGVLADVAPAGLYEDGSSLLSTLGEPRLTNYLRLKTWFDRGLVIGGGSDHQAGLDSLGAPTPWNPWLGIWTALTRTTSRGTVINPEERLTREQAIRLYTYNNAYLNFEENRKGSLEPGKLADLIMVDTDILKCPVDDIRNTHVLMTMVNGKIVWEAKRPVIPTLEPAIITSTNRGPTVTVTNLLTTIIVTNQVPTIATTVSTPATGSDTNQTVAVNAGTLATTVTITNEVTAIIVTNAVAAVAGTNEVVSNAVVAVTEATNAVPTATNVVATVEAAPTTAAVAVTTIPTTNIPVVEQLQPVAVTVSTPATAVTNQTVMATDNANQADDSDWSQIKRVVTGQPLPVRARTAPAAIAQPQVVVEPLPAQVQSQPATVVIPQAPVTQPTTVSAPVIAQPIVQAVQALPEPTPQAQPVQQLLPGQAMQLQVAPQQVPQPVQQQPVPAQPVSTQPQETPAVQPQTSPDQPPPAQAVKFHPLPAQIRQ